MPKPENKLSPSSRAVSGAILNRQKASFSSLQEESAKAYEGVSKDNPLSDNGKNAHQGYDAFRHAYGSARLTQEYGPEVANFLGRGLEALAAATRENSSVTNNSAEIGMDLFNNKVGRDIGQSLGPKATPEQIRSAVESAAKEGRLIVNSQDPRATEVFNNQYDMKALSAAHSGYLAISNGISRASDILDKSYEAAKQQAQSHIEVMKDALKQALEKTPDSKFFKFSEAHLEKGDAYAKTAPAEAVSAIASVAQPGKEWQMSKEEYNQVAKLDSTKDSSPALAESLGEKSEESGRHREEQRRDDRTQTAKADREMELEASAA